jgi:hypothetical protein
LAGQLGESNFTVLGIGLVAGALLVLVRIGVNDGSIGTLNVKNGGHIESGFSFIGIKANSTGQVNVASISTPATWLLRWPMVVMNKGRERQ